MTSLRLDHVTAGHHGDADTVIDVSLVTGDAGITAVLGPSGSGKSTLLLTIAGILPLRDGSITLGDRTLATRTKRLAPEKRGVGWVPQDAALFPHLNVAGNVGFGLQGRGRSGAGAERVAALLDAVGLDGFGERAIDTLSGGQASRVALARALAPKPDLVLLDEPFAALDAGLRVALRRDVAAAIRSDSRSALVVTHDQAEAFALADIVAVMRSGRLEQIGTPEELYDAPANAWLAGFVGESTLVPAQREGDAFSTPLGAVPAGSAKLTDALLVVRPEHVKPYAGGVPTIVEDVEFEGRDRIVRLRAASLETPLLMRVAAGVKTERGMRIPVRVAGIPHAIPRDR